MLERERDDGAARGRVVLEGQQHVVDEERRVLVLRESCSAAVLARLGLYLG